MQQEEIKTGNESLDIANKLDRYKKEALDFRKQYEQRWKECEDFYHGKQWKNSDKKSVKNWVFRTIESEIPILTDSSPSTDVISLSDKQEHEDAAKMLESAIHYSYRKGDIQLKLTQQVRSALMTGTGWMYVDFDPDKENGMGGITYNVINWRRVLIDPTADEIDAARYVVIMTPMDKDEIKRMFPKVKLDFANDSDVNEMDYRLGNSLNQLEYHAAPADQTGNVSRYQRDMYIVDECWFKDYSMEKVSKNETNELIQKETIDLQNGVNPKVDKYQDHKAHISAHKAQRAMIVAEALQMAPEMITEQDEETLKQDPLMAVIFSIMDDHEDVHESFLQTIGPGGERPKYKNNFRLVIKLAKQVLYDGEPPVEDGLVPLVPLYAYKEEGSPYGIGEALNLIWPQKSFNEMDQQEIQGLRLCTNPGWLKDNNSKVSDEDLTNEPGIVITKAVGTEVRRLEPGVVSQQLAIRKQDDLQAIESISGVTEATMGERPAGVTAASAIARLQSQSVGRIRLKSRYIEQYSMPRLGRLTASRICKYWSSYRLLKLYDNDGEIKSTEWNPEMIDDLEYEVMIIPGSTAGIDKGAISDIYKELLIAGTITAEMFFKITDLPMKNKALALIKEEKDKQAQMQQAQMQAQQQMSAIENDAPPTEEELQAIGAQ